jgi:phage antirepressor YoqD-like protein
VGKNKREGKKEMNELTNTGDKRMTVREVAEALGVTPEAIKKHVRALYPDIIKNGIETIINEEQVTAIKQKMMPTTKVVGALTSLDIERMTLQVIEYHAAKVRELEKENAEKTERLAIAEPKAELADLAMLSADTLTMDKAAQILKLPYGRNTLFAKLRGAGILKENNTPYQEYVDRGYFRVDEKPLLVGDTVRIKPVTKVTQKGVEWMAKSIPSATNHRVAV